MSGSTALKLITRIEDLPPLLRDSITPEESAFIRTLKQEGRLPLGVTPFYASLALPGLDDPIRKQCIPDPREAITTPFETVDPLGAASYNAAPRLVHQYRDRVLLLTHGTCPGYCRHCFRRDWISSPEGFITEKEIRDVSNYIQNHTEVREILLSGGDPLVAPDRALERLFSVLRESRKDLLLRVGSRVPVTAPGRVTPGLAELLARFKPLRLVVHINHPRELAPEVREGLERVVSAGIPVHTQTVLLRGINDDAETLASLFRESLNTGISPYYLLQGDLAPGTGHLRVNLRRGIDIYRELKGLISGLGYPHYALDLPGGGGKVMLHESSIIEERDSPRGWVYILKDSRGKTYEYPREHPDGQGLVLGNID